MGIGTLANFIAIIIGGTIGVLAKSFLTDKYKQIFNQALGLSILLIGLSGALSGVFSITKSGEIETGSIMIIIISLFIGGFIGVLLDLENRINKFGEFIQQKFFKNDKLFSQGFVTTSIIFCVGALSLVGALDEGISGNPETLYTKSILDGISSIIFATTLGIGVVFSAIPVLIYQGGLTFLASSLEGFLTDEIITQMVVIGSLIIIGISFSVLEIKKFSLANFLPAVFIPLIFSILSGLF